MILSWELLVSCLQNSMPRVRFITLYVIDVSMWGVGREGGGEWRRGRGRSFQRYDTCWSLYPSNITARNFSKHVMWPNISQVKLLKTSRFVAKKKLKDNNTITPCWRENMLGYFSLDTICPSRLTVFFEHSSRKTGRFSEQKLSADKYPSMFSRQMEVTVYIRSTFSL